MEQRSEQRRACRVAAGALLVAWAASGCRSLLGVDGYGTLPPDSGQSDGAAGDSESKRCDRNTYASDGCRDCVDRACCEEATACSGEPACAVLSGCLAECDPADAACRVKCNLSTRRTGEMSALMACAAKSCSECAVGHATFGGLACHQCLEREDPDDLRAFAANRYALELQSCRADCPPSYEYQCACDDYVARGGAVLSALANVSLCTDDCGTPDWSCLGSVHWPRLADTAPELELDVGAADVISLKPLLGATVSACAGIDSNCTQPIQTVTVEDTYADLMLTRAGTGVAATDYFGAILVTWSDTTRPDASSVLLSFFPSLRRTPAWTWRRLVSRANAENIVKGALIPDRLAWENFGGIVWSVAACNDVSAAGLTASLDSGERAYYLEENQILDAALTETTTSGLGAFINVTPGPRTLDLRRSSGQKVGSYPIYVRTGTTSTVSLTPGPDSDP